eukprot:TRINITY_DN2780_c0_g4_i1.p1 TRINITY_DN2780_c0_g4~~TRINITY_DN2780_c0_g4_i1.p1  ORF type:complete len:381 (+),score=116.51 TRINITY_DN2780_c0_g4_i1:118-1260(+)
MADEEYQPGDAVECLEGEDWFPATLKKVRGDGTLDVVWEDGGETRKKVPPEEVRRPKKRKEKKAKKAKRAEEEEGAAEEEPEAPQVSPKKSKKEKKAKAEAAEADGDESAGIPSRQTSALPRETSGMSREVSGAAVTRTTTDGSDGRSRAQVLADIAAVCDELKKQPGAKEYRCARWTVEEKLGVKFAAPQLLQIVWASDGAAERFLDEDAFGMILTHVDGEPVKSVADVKRTQGSKLAFRWTLGPCDAPLPAVDPAKDPLVEKVFVHAVKEIDGKTFFCCRVTRALEARHLGPPIKREVAKRYSHFDEFRKALLKQGYEDKCFPEKTLTKCSGAQLDARRKALDTWVGSLVKAQKDGMQKAVNEFFLGSGDASPPESPR